MDQMRAQAMHVGTEIVADHIDAVDLKRAALLAQGRQRHGIHRRRAHHRHRRAGPLARPALGEASFKGYRRIGLRHLRRLLLPQQELCSWSAAATPPSRSRIYLANIASQVILVHRRGVLRAEKILQERLFANPKIEVMWHTELDEVLGTDDPLGVNGARLKSTLTGETFAIPVDGIFIAIGHEPQTELFKGQIEMKP